jgi:nitrous oxide reductase
MMKNAESSRRGFFKAVAIGGAAAAATVATTLVGQRTAAPDTTAAEGSTRAGYRETAHIRHYYRTTQV